MRESIGATWILQLVIIFMLIFVGFLALTINYTRAFRMKNEMLSFIEKYEGVNTKNDKNLGQSGSIAQINNYLMYNNYQTMGVCQQGYYGVNNLNSTSISPADGKSKYYYCIKKNNSKSATFPDRANYEIEVFFHFNLPMIGDLFTFRVNGRTVDINFPTDDMK